MLKCINCAWLYNPTEWEQHQIKKENEQKQKEEKNNVDLNETSHYNSQIKEIKKLCRQCGEYYSTDEEHRCK